MRTEAWYLTPDGWVCGTSSEDAVETAVPPPAGHVAIVEVSRRSAESWEGAQFQRLSRQEQSSPLEEKFGALPPLLAAELRRRIEEPRVRSEPTPAAPSSRGYSGIASWASLAIPFTGALAGGVGLFVSGSDLGVWLVLGVLGAPAGAIGILLALFGGQRALRARAWLHLAAAIAGLALNGIWLALFAELFQGHHSLRM